MMTRRTTLFRIEPIALGTPMVESLTSLILRLAAAHTTTPALLHAKVLVPAAVRADAGDERPISFSWSRPRFFLMNGTAELAERYASAIGELSGQSAPIGCTLRAWKPWISPHRLLRQARAWCPCCLDEFSASPGGTYEPLVWSLRLYASCPRHGPIVDICPSCGRSSSHLARIMFPGCCPFCGVFLGSSRAIVGMRADASRETQLEALLGRSGSIDRGIK